MTEKDLRKLGRQDLLQMLVTQSREVARQRAALKELEISLNEADENNDKLRNRLDEKDETIERLKERLNEKDAQIEKFKERLNEKDALIEKLKDRLDEKDGLIRKLFGEDALSLIRIGGLSVKPEANASAPSELKAE